MSGDIHFVVPGGDVQVSANDRLYHIAIQATAVMLKDWFREEEPSPEKAQQMIESIMKGLLGSRMAST
jgi:hypothetical protein